MNTVRQVLKEKGAKVWAVQVDQPVFDALQLMLDKNIGALAVLEGDKWSVFSPSVIMPAR